MNTVLPLRVTLLVMDRFPEQAPDLIRRIFRAYWAEDRDLADSGTIAALAVESGLDGPALVEETKLPAVKEALRKATEAARDAGVFGAPSFVVHADEPRLYWGSDRLAMAAAAAAGDERLY
jgi:2-hydroxychromene-2-carboxylate isomerase